MLMIRILYTLRLDSATTGSYSAGDRPGHRHQSPPPPIPRVCRAARRSSPSVAIVDYLRRGRPRTALGRTVFVRVKAPRRALAPGGVSHVVDVAGQRAGLGPLDVHRLRHIAATHMLRAGARSARSARSSAPSRAPSRALRRERARRGARRTAKLLVQFTAFLEAIGAGTVTVGAALASATLSNGSDSS